jgi:tetratricopeptide (TPR) repeat protein
MLLFVPAAQAEESIAQVAQAEAAVAAHQRGLELQARDPSAARLQSQAAIDHYERLAEAGPANAKLFCNLGHACLLAGDTGKAVLYYRRAERLEPGNANVQAGLAQAATLLGRHAAPATSGSDPLLLERNFGPWLVLVLGLAALVLGWAIVLCAIRFNRRWLFVTAAPLLLCALVLMGSVTWKGWWNERFPAGVISQGVMLREGNGSNFRAVLDHELPPGVEFRMVSQKEDWLRVQLQDGTRGWLPQERTVQLGR